MVDSARELRQGSEQAVSPGGIAGIFAKIMKLKPVRVYLHYASKGGPLMASGLSFQGLFAVFAAIWLAFSIAGLVIQGNTGLRASLITALAGVAPGLIDNGTGSGAIDPKLLLEAGVLGWTGAIALAGLLATTLGWLASARDAVRAMFALAASTTNIFLLKLKDLGVAAVFGAAIIVSTILSAVSTALLGFVLTLVGIGSDSVVATVLGRIVGLAIVLALDTFVLAALYRVLSGVKIPARRLIGGALIGGVALGALKVLGNVLLGGASSNPLLASFAVIIGLLIFFNLVCQVILLCAAWIAVGMVDHGIAADPQAEAARLEQERLTNEAEEAAREEARRPNWVRRLTRRMFPHRPRSDVPAHEGKVGSPT